MKQTRRWRKTSGTTALSIALAWTLVPAGGLAESKTTTIVREKPAPKIEARVEKLYNEGVVAAEHEQWEKARQLFTEAFSLDPRPQIAANLGHAELRLGKSRDAAEHFDYFLREDRDTDPEARAEIKALFDTAALRIAIVSVAVDHDGADVFMNQSFVGKSPLKKRLFLEPDSYTFKATKNGLKPGTNSLDLSRGASVGVKIVMGEATMGTVLPNGNTNAPQTTNWRAPLTIAAGGLAGIGIGVGIGLMVRGNQYVEESDQILDELQRTTPAPPRNGSVCNVDKNRTQCTEATEPDERGILLRKAGTVAFAVGGVALVGAIVLVAMPKTAKRNLGIIPTAGQTQTGVVVYGAF